jgi:shikimate dehydrogenase
MSSQNFLAALTGSFSTPCGDNPTVAMIEAAYHHHDMNARYINCDVKPDGLADAIAGAVAMGWAGFNCSIPHKVAVLEHLDRLAESASIIGAVNCVVLRDGRRIGENTDGKGFLASLTGVTDPAGKRVCLLGAGGAARAIAVELALAGAAHLTIVNRDAERGQDLAALVNESTPAEAVFQKWTGAFTVPKDTDVLINATSVGLGDAKAMPDVDTDSLRPGLVVADVIPNPPHTALLRAAAEKGSVTLDGLGMLVNQGVISIKLWFDASVEPSVMARKLQDIFGVTSA